ncbi:TPA: hypothetical protein I0I20_RS02970 [Enterococcus faecium]
MSDYLTAEQYEDARKTGDWESGKVLTHGQALNDNQKIVLEWLKYPLNDIPNRFAKNYFAYVTCLFLGQAPDKVLKAYQELSPEQQLEVLSAFAQWGLEQEETE